MEFKEIRVFGCAPVNNSLCPSAGEVLRAMAAEGWDFAGNIPGKDHDIAEYRRATVFLFKRPDGGMPSRICSYGGEIHAGTGPCLNCGEK